jgi:hypothetical protein
MSLTRQTPGEIQKYTPLAIALVLAGFALFSATRPPASNLTVTDLERIQNGEPVEYRRVDPYLPLTLLCLAGVIGCVTWFALVHIQPGPVYTLVEEAEPEPAPETGPEKEPVDHTQRLATDPQVYLGNPAKILANRCRPTLILANPRIGKGITIAHAYRLAQVHKNALVWAIQPKYHWKERWYWEDCDNLLGFMLEEILNDAEACQQKQDEIIAFIHDFRKVRHDGPKLLIVDELMMMEKCWAVWFRKALVPQIAVELSSGETDGRGFWGMTQSGAVEDVRMSGGARSTFDLLTIQNPDSTGHLASLRKSFPWIPEMADKETLFRQSHSPKQAVFFHSAYENWLPLVAFETREPQVPMDDGEAAALSPAPETVPESPSMVGDWIDDHAQRLVNPPNQQQIIAVARALGEQKSPTSIIKEVLGYQGRNYDKGKALFDSIMAIIKENE